MPTSPKIFYAGDTIFSEGDLSYDVYLIKEGCVQIVQKIRGRKVEIARLYNGEIFGEMAFFDNGPRSATAIAATDCLIYELSDKLVQDVIQRNPIWFRALTRVLINRLRETTSKYNYATVDHPVVSLRNLVLTEIARGRSSEDISLEIRNYLKDADALPLKNILYDMVKKKQI